MLSFFPRDVLDEILIFIESVSEGFLSYYYMILVLEANYRILYRISCQTDLGLNNILFIQISPAKHIHTKFVEDLNESILLIEFISSCIIYTFYFVHCNSMTII